ncbi:hypothetical protein JQV27_20245 [Sulfitobacter mediterraneus]|uniref:type II secretion system protein N n=1 Tax=Sulfitobacter mediterraneus TaxID=83219 RepID=UPI001934612D|nr:type II secretion system protein N [Sulfitobacter mediterraneus]MBM1635200.1 hypothetical protein [Sulfitobacter mediterraneus]MBM1643051.1 hypothetical protein [Sulfitobacter mediterraneus]MBM1647099.1 hypothetical protein [Sulfitobacter mediterraneus]MBM1651141.1 hypothetical protein [Sulfitobacter mediterraneus]MBM1655132.1 hypothetical protein [Sulfitobacter mediterraneus]
MTAGRLWMFTLVAVLGLVASLVFAGTRLIWHAQGHTAVMPEPLPKLAREPRDNAPSETGVIIALAPFGRSAIVAEAPTPMAQQLDVVLRGVLVDPDPEASRAFLQVSGQTSVFRLSDRVASAELVAINTDTVTLRSGEALVIVGFDGIEGNDPSAEPQISKGPDSDTADPFARLAAAIVPGKGSIDLREAPSPETTEEYINYWRDRITENPQAAMDTVGVELVENGYRIKPDPNLGVVLAGLRPGDVVTRLNGQTLGDLDRDRLLYDEVAAAGIARVEVERDGRALLLTFPLR